jgi:hypothetical protein
VRGFPVEVEPGLRRRVVEARGVRREVVVAVRRVDVDGGVALRVPGAAERERLVRDQVIERAQRVVADVVQHRAAGLVDDAVDQRQSLDADVGVDRVAVVDRVAAMVQPLMPRSRPARAR